MGDEFSWDTFAAFDEGIVDANWGPETRALGAADVDRRERVFLLNQSVFDRNNLRAITAPVQSNQPGGGQHTAR